MFLIFFSQKFAKKIFLSFLLVKLLGKFFFSYFALGKEEFLSCFLSKNCLFAVSFSKIYSKIHPKIFFHPLCPKSCPEKIVFLIFALEKLFRRKFSSCFFSKNCPQTFFCCGFSKICPENFFLSYLLVKLLRKNFFLLFCPGKVVQRKNFSILFSLEKLPSKIFFAGFFSKIYPETFFNLFCSKSFLEKTFSHSALEKLIRKKFFSCFLS